VRDVRSSDGRENVVFGPDVPPVLTRFTLAPAGTPLDETVVAHLEDMNRDERLLSEVLVDRGYSQLSDTGFHHPVRRAGMELIFQPKGDHQRLQAPFSEFAVVIDGQLFSALMPKHLWRELPWPPYGASEAEVFVYEQAYNERSRWRFQLHAGPRMEPPGGSVRSTPASSARVSFPSRCAARGMPHSSSSLSARSAASASSA
jgi:hypothetical protein